jgi:hypothetical protein
MVVLAAGFPLTLPPGAPHFTDVPPAHPFYLFIEVAFDRGIISGYDCAYFRPYADVTRGQITKFVVLAAGLPVVTPPNPRFADVPPTHPFYSYIETAALYGVVGGYACGGPGEPCDAQNRPYYRPGNYATRAQFAKIIFQAFALPRRDPGSMPGLP